MPQPFSIYASDHNDQEANQSGGGYTINHVLQMGHSEEGSHHVIEVVDQEEQQEDDFI